MSGRRRLVESFTEKHNAFRKNSPIHKIQYLVIDRRHETICQEKVNEHPIRAKGEQEPSLAYDAHVFILRGYQGRHL